MKLLADGVVQGLFDYVRVLEAEVTFKHEQLKKIKAQASRVNGRINNHPILQIKDLFK